MEQSVGVVAALARYPVKSLVGEPLDRAAVDTRGLRGDRRWAVRDEDGRFGSGKTTRRFRRMPGLLGLSAVYDGDVPVVVLPDGRRLRGDDPGIHAALTAYVGRPVTLAAEGAVSHFDEGPLHLVTTSSLARLGELAGGPVDVRRLRANLVVDTGSEPAFAEQDWIGREVRLGDAVVGRVRAAMTRCVMLDLPQVGLPADGRLLAAVAAVNDTRLGVVVDVVGAGTLRVGDAVHVAGPAGRMMTG